MQSSSVVDIEKQARDLSASEQWWLVEQILENLRAKAEEGKRQAELAAMAADPDIQREIQQMQKEFKEMESDGLESI